METRAKSELDSSPNNTMLNCNTETHTQTHTKRAFEVASNKHMAMPTFFFKLFFFSSLGDHLNRVKMLSQNYRFFQTEFYVMHHPHKKQTPESE